MRSAIESAGRKLRLAVMFGVLSAFVLVGTVFFSQPQRALAAQSTGQASVLVHDRNDDNNRRRCWRDDDRRHNDDRWRWCNRHRNGDDDRRHHGDKRGHHRDDDGRHHRDDDGRHHGKGNHGGGNSNNHHGNNHHGDK